MSERYGLDACAAQEVARKVEALGVAKARMATAPLCLLGVIAGSFIGLGTLFFVLVKSDPSPGFATSQVLGGSVLVGLACRVIYRRPPSR